MWMFAPLSHTVDLSNGLPGSPGPPGDRLSPQNCTGSPPCRLLLLTGTCTGHRAQQATTDKES